MYELNRARLVGIGPRGARYTDVTLDLSGVGVGIERQTLFAERRPSPYTLLMLENGGGKSVLLSLLFSVVLPGKKKTVGGAALDKFVLESDTGHVALEWLHVRTGERLVTAKVFQRRAPTPGNSNVLHEAWYSFRPSSALDLSTLPVADSGRRRRLDGYRDAVEQADKADPTTQLVWMGDDQGRWRTHLRDSGIEPDLFDIQRSMNADEGDAADAFKFSSSKAFVDWLLRTVTDPADAASVADTFEQWATTLADRTKMLRERDFLEGAIAGLEPLAHAWHEHTAAEHTADRVHDTAATLNGAIAVRLDEERGRSHALRAEAEAARERAGAAERATRDARDTRNELQLVTARLERGEVEAAERAIDGELTAVELELAGWDQARALQRATDADAQARSLADQVADADRGAANDLARRDEAAGLVLAKLDAEAAASDEQEAELRDQAQAARDAAGEATESWADARQRAAVARNRQDVAEATIARTDAALEVAAKQGLIPGGARVADIPGLLETAVTDHAQQKSALEAAGTRAGDCAARLRAEDVLLATAVQTLPPLIRAADVAQGASDTADLAAARVAALPAVIARAGDRDEFVSDGDAPERDVGGHDRDGSEGTPALTPEELDRAADTLLDVLAADSYSHTEHYDTLRQEQREDTRVLQALGDGGLLPPRTDVDAAVGVLTAAGVAAHPGWRYLRDTAAVADRESLIGAHPELADGVVLVDPTQLPAAERALQHARLLPAAAVVVGSGVALLARPAHEAGSATVTNAPGTETMSGIGPVFEMGAGSGMGTDARFVITPSPAMYDEDAAEQTRADLIDTLTRRSEQIEDVQRQLTDVRNAYDRLTAWRLDNPPGHLAVLRDSATAARAAVDVAQDIVGEQQTRRDEAAHQKDAADAAVTDLRSSERTAADRRDLLDRLAERARDGIEAAEMLPFIAADIRDAEATADQADTRRARHQRASDAHIRLAEQIHAQGQRMRAACSEVTSTSGARAGYVPDDPLQVLQARARAAHATYLAAAADPDLRAKAEEAADAAREQRAHLDRQDPKHVAEGRRLLTTAAGADRTGWATALENARGRRDQLRGDKDTLIAQLGRLGQAITQQEPEKGTRWVTLPPDKVPTNAADGRAMTCEANAQLITAQTTFDAARAAADKLDAERQAAEVAMQGFREATLPLRAVLGTAPAPGAPDSRQVDVRAYAGTTDDALAASEAAVAALNRTREKAADTRRALDAATDELTQYTQQDRYDDVPNPVRRSILGTDRAMLGSRAQEWAALLRARHASLVTDLESADRHRRSIVERLAALVTQALSTLRQATRLSRLPDDLDDWAGRTFLRIGYSEPDIGAIRVRVASVVDDLATAFAGRGAAARSGRSRRDAMGLLLDAVHAAVPKGFTVDVLKPDSVLRDERVAVEEMHDIFSGGQELTAAIVLYCTLAALKANQRGQMRAKHSGVLFLDNPIGKASATYLLDVQQAVARSLGVQLIYTTGLFDDRVLASFPLWIRLRNDADLRAGLKHIRVAEVVAQALPDPYSDGELEGSGVTGGAPGTVTATRVHRRPTSTHAAGLHEGPLEGSPGAAPARTDEPVVSA